MQTLVDVALREDPAIAGIIEEVIRAYPELGKAGTRNIPGRSMKMLVRNAASLPNVGPRSINEGTDSTHGSRIQKIFQTASFNPHWWIDVLLAKSDSRGEDVLMMEDAKDNLDATIAALAAGWYYGDGEDDAMLGLFQTMNDTYRVNAGGTANADMVSSVVMVSFAPGDVTMLMGNNGDFDVSGISERTVKGTNDKDLTAKWQELTVFPGPYLGRDFAVARIANVTAQAGKGLTDALLDELYGTLPPGYVPTDIFATKKAIGQLHTSRRTLDLSSYVPRPVDYNGTPISETASLSNAEDIVTFS